MEKKENGKTNAMGFLFLIPLHLTNIKSKELSVKKQRKIPRRPKKKFERFL